MYLPWLQYIENYCKYAVTLFVITGVKRQLFMQMKHTVELTAAVQACSELGLHN